MVGKVVVQDRPSEIERTIGSEDSPHVYRGKWLKGRGVCAPCNSGWMSNLEVSVKPILEPAIFDSPSSLDYVQQLGIAIWTLKTAMVFECLKGAANVDAMPGEVFYSAADRQHLTQWSTPPPDSFVWLGRYEPEFSLWAQNDRLSNAQPQGFFDEASATTFAMGRCVIQTLTVPRIPRTSNDLQTRPIRHGESMWNDALNSDLARSQ